VVVGPVRLRYKCARGHAITDRIGFVAIIREEPGVALALEASPMKVILWILGVLIALFVLQKVARMLFWFLAALRDTGWTGEHKEAGPLPLSSPDMPIVRLVEKRSTFEMEYKRLLWDEGNGPIEARDRIKPLIESVPKEFVERMFSKIKVPAKYFVGLRDKTGTSDEPKYEGWGVVVSLNPDVLIVSVHECSYGPQAQRRPRWDISLRDKARSAYIHARIEYIEYGYGYFSPHLYAGTLVPWSKEMHVFSTDPTIKSGRLIFDVDQATVVVPAGKLVLRHHDDDVDVTRQ